MCRRCTAASSVTENDWKRRVLDAAKLFGWRFAHFRPAQTTKGWRTAMEGHKGFPDLVLVRSPRVIFAELKVAAKLTDEQAEWLDALGTSPGVESYVWRPTDWESVYLTLAKDLAPVPVHAPPGVAAHEPNATTGIR
jgi:hypothetical protein